MNPLHDLLTYLLSNEPAYVSWTKHKNNTLILFQCMKLIKQIIKEKQGSESRYSLEPQKAYLRCDCT